MLPLRTTNPSACGLPACSLYRYTGFFDLFLKDTFQVHRHPKLHQYQRKYSSYSWTCIWNKDLMAERSHYELCIFNKVLKLTFFFLSNVPQRWIIPVLHFIAFCSYSQIAKTILKIADLSRSKRII